ncbi:MinD/ParA family ATP-binding protein [Halocatena salina]|uniref:P-loop NTPase n=1 Tax=Halocatena salina TaxID=2934340 RepID=A0A8U0A023_9EURY|nr:P-loop NTPase [Halocatena salina]UPM42461.1 P-loop NTPase [Halocatena salina]
MPATVYAIAGGKGGVGKTTTAVNLGATLRATGRVVGLIDADLAMSDLQGLLGFSHEPTVHEVLADTASIAESCIKHVVNDDGSGRLDIYPGSPSLEDYGNADPDRLEDVVKSLAPDYDSLILDTGTGLTRDTAIPLKLADQTIVVTTPTEVAVVDARKTIRFANRLGGTIKGAVVSRTCNGLTDGEVTNRMNVSQMTTIPPFDAFPRDVLRAYRQLAVRLLDGTDTTDRVQNCPAMVLTPVVLTETEVDAGGVGGTAGRTRAPHPPEESTDADQSPDTDDTLDDTEETASDDVPGWFTGMVK